MQILDTMSDQEAKLNLKKTRRGKRCGSRRTRWKKEDHFGDENPNLVFVDISTENVKSEKCRKFYVRPRYSPKAPHNSTQFLMEDRHQCLDASSGGEELSFYSCFDMSGLSINSERKIDTSHFDFDSIDLKGTPVDAKTFMTNDFESFYDNMRTEELFKLSKDDLVEEVLHMHDHVSSLEERIQDIQKKPCHSYDIRRSLCRDSISMNKSKRASTTTCDNIMSTLHTELERLQSENQSLKSEKESIIL